MKRVLVLAVVLVAGACAGGAHDPLIDELDALALPASVSFFADVKYGSTTGFMGSDPLVARYYLSDLPPEDLCEDLADIKAALDLSDRRTGGAACKFGRPSSPDDRGFQMTVTGPREAVPAGDDTINSTPIDVPHRSVLVASIG
ncbi:MAG: hypothetical protein O6951_08990 [Actinobacteria bacterium]|nr:hypothetical protein [Actinomycetota bacterium]